MGLLTPWGALDMASEAAPFKFNFGTASETEKNVAQDVEAEYNEPASEVVHKPQVWANCPDHMCWGLPAPPRASPKMQPAGKPIRSVLDDLQGELFVTEGVSIAEGLEVLKVSSWVYHGGPEQGPKEARANGADLARCNAVGNHPGLHSPACSTTCTRCTAPSKAATSPSYQIIVLAFH